MAPGVSFVFDVRLGVVFLMFLDVFYELLFLG